MPWQALEWPSLQLGILHQVLAGAGIATQTLTLGLAFAEHVVAATAGRPEVERIHLRDYQTVAQERYAVGLGEWIFAVPPFRSPSPADDEIYLAYLRREGIPETEIARARTMRELVPAFLARGVAEILALAPRVVGFTSAFSQTIPSLALALLLKAADPSIAIVLGGANCEGPMGAALHKAFPWIDAVVRGEAERVLPELVQDLLARRAVRPQPGLCYRNGQQSFVVAPAAEGAVSMDEVPAPTFDEYFERLHKSELAGEILPHVQILYEASRGCWWGAISHCTFCGLNGSNMAFRSRTPSRVVEDVLALARRHGTLDFLFVDNILDLRYLQEVLPRLQEAGFDLSIFYEAKANLRKEQIRLLRAAGVDRLGTGIESLSTPILRLMRKGVTAFQNVRVLKWCAEFGIHPYWNLLYGFPREPAAEYARMSEILPSLTHFEPPRLARLSLDRFSPYHARPGEFGLEVVGPLPYYRLLYPADTPTLNDLAYSFAYRHADGRDPETYVAPVRALVDAWRANRDAGLGTLRYRRGPGVVRISDRRVNLEPVECTLTGRAADIYLACVDGATPREISNTLVEAGSNDDVRVDDIRAFLDSLVARRLVFSENDRYLALALPDSAPGRRITPSEP